MRGGSIKLVVVDASWWLAYLYPDELHNDVIEMTDDFLSGSRVQFMAPPLLPYELGNLFRVSIGRKRLLREMGVILFNKFLNFPIKYCNPIHNQLLDFVLIDKLTYYDAAYIWLALEKKTELLTLDHEMKKVWERLKNN
jgi:predicted nucleic acid-binding protein